MAIKQNIVIDIGANFELEFRVTDIGDASIDFSSYTANVQLKKHHFSVNSTPFTSNLYSNGSILISMDSAVTKNLDPGRYVYDVLVDDGEVKTRVVEGVATATPCVSK